MACLVNIIHPYIYKLTGDTFNIGPMEECEARDKLFAYLIEQALKSGAHIIHHRDSHPKDITGIMREVAFMMDKHYTALFDERIDSVVTTPHGCPIVDERPEEIPLERWEEYSRYFTSHSDLMTKVGHPDRTFFIGGALEACLANAAVYHHENYRHDGERVFYIPDLCVCYDESRKAMAEDILKKRNIEAICVNGAVKLMKK